MRKNHLLTAALFVAALSSCSQDEQLSLTNEDKSVFTGSMEVIGSRTELEDNKVVWKGDETISIFEMDNVNAQYKVSGAVKDGIATFEFVDFIKPEQVVTLGSNYAVYPYNKENKIDADGNISAPVSAEYTFTDRASSIATALMVAKTDGTRFNFTNAQGLICLRLNAQQPYKWGTIQSIKLTSAGKMLSGTAKMTWKEGNEAPIAVIQEGGGKELTINLSDENKKELPASQDKEYAEFYVPVVPTLFEADDLTLTVEFADSKKYEVIINKTFEVERKEIQSLKHTIGASTWEGEIEGDLINILDKPANIGSAADLDNILKTPVVGILYFTSSFNYANDTQENDKAIEISENSDVTLNLNNQGITSGSSEDYGLIAHPASKVTINDANITSNGGGIGAVGGAEVVFNSGSVYVDTPSTSGRYIFYAEGEGSTITINGGTFSWDPADNQKRAYIYAGTSTTVYVKGGTFGKASTRSGYTAGILGSGTVIITGGTFGFDPSNWVATGYKATKNDDNTWTVAAE